jgi:hypothetical protein
MSVPARLSPSRTQLGRSRTQLDRSRTQLDRSRTQLGRSRTQLESSRTQLGRSRTQLGRSRTQLGRSRTQLGRSRTQLGRSRTQLGRSRTQLCPRQIQAFCDVWERFQALNATKTLFLTFGIPIDLAPRAPPTLPADRETVPRAAKASGGARSGNLRCRQLDRRWYVWHFFVGPPTDGRREAIQEGRMRRLTLLTTTSDAGVDGGGSPG